MDLTRRPKLMILTVIALFSLCLAACDSLRLTQESSSVDVAVFSGTASTWKKDGIVITIQFANGKVVAKQFSKEKNVR